MGSNEPNTSYLYNSLYGFKQAARNWNNLVNDVLTKLGFTRSQADNCLYVHPTLHIILLVYVDDILGAAPKTTQLAWFHKEFNKDFKANNLEEVSKFLGMRITRDRKNKKIYLDQEMYLDKALGKFGVPNGRHNAVTTPANGYENL